jgi:hypothetical protein
MAYWACWLIGRKIWKAVLVIDSAISSSSIVATEGIPLPSCVVVTCCTDRKRGKPNQVLQARDLTPGSYRDVAAAWLRRIEASSAENQAKAVYCGRAFSEALAAASHLESPMWIVSAGLGLVRANEPIPTYSLTVSRGAPDSILTKIVEDQPRSRDWWAALVAEGAASRSLHGIVNETANTIVLISLSAAYAKMLENEFEAMAEDQIDRLRIFGLSLDRALPERFHRAVMPYDRRLDGTDSPLPGTLTDFSTRAMRHFAQMARTGEIKLEDLREDRTVVLSKLSGWTEPLVPKRIPKSDDEIKDLIIKHWLDVEGQSGRMLRYLRDDLLVACEQGRFRNLFNQVAKNRAETQRGLL